MESDSVHLLIETSLLLDTCSTQPHVVQGPKSHNLPSASPAPHPMHAPSVTLTAACEGEVISPILEERTLRHVNF